MIHFSIIHSDFVKLAMRWSEMDYDQQQQYLDEHRKSKRKITAVPNVSGFKDYVRGKKFVNLQTSERVPFHKLPLNQQELMRQKHEKQYHIDREEKEKKLEQEMQEKQKQDDVFKQDVSKQVDELINDSTVESVIEEHGEADELEHVKAFKDWIDICKLSMHILIGLYPGIVSDEDFIAVDKLIHQLDESEGEFGEKEFNQVRKHTDKLMHRYLSDKAVLGNMMQDRIVKLNEMIRKNSDIVNDSLYKRLKEVIDKFSELDKQETTYFVNYKANELYARFDVIMKMLNQKYRSK